MEQINELSAYVIETEALTVSSDNLLDEIAYALQPELRLNVEPGNWRRLVELTREMKHFDYDNEAPATRAGQVISLVMTLWHMFKHASATVYSQHMEIRGLRRKLQQTSAELEAANSAIIDARVWIDSLRETIAEQEEARVSYQQEAIELSRQPQNDNYRAGYVYLITASNGTYKIGRTKNPEDRMKTFGLRLPFAVEYLAVIQTDDMYILEKELHRRFKKKRLSGSEFFQLAEDDVNYIIGLAHTQETQAVETVLEAEV